MAGGASMNQHFRELRIPDHALAQRKDPAWDGAEQEDDHRGRVLSALVDGMHDVLVARYIHDQECGVDTADRDPEFVASFWDPLWDSLRDSLTRQDLLRFLFDFAQREARGRAQETIEGMFGDLSMLDDGAGIEWLTQNPG